MALNPTLARVWPDGTPPLRLQLVAVCNGCAEILAQRFGVTRSGSVSGADLGRSSDYSIGGKHSSWMRLRTGVEHISVSTAVARGLGGR